MERLCFVIWSGTEAAVDNAGAAVVVGLWQMVGMELLHKRYIKHHCLRQESYQSPQPTDPFSTRRIDMIAFQDTNKGWIIDPTIRMESHADQPIEVHNEKCSIYNATISYYKNKYQLKDIVGLGLMVGARGNITSQFVQFCRQFNLDKNFIKEIAITKK
ncbi:hypothetical protein C0J52_21824 [Blattella germanica]|nr:hypothetical protein C0J52_21824 [Blattella germanica]